MVRDDIIINDNNILVDILYCPQGNLGEVDAFNWVNYYEKELIDYCDKPLNEYNIEFNHKFESNTMHFGEKNEIFFLHLHKFCENNNINPSQITFTNANFKIWENYRLWKLNERPNAESINFKCIFHMMNFYSEYTFNDYPLKQPEDSNWIFLNHIEVNADRPMNYVYNCLNRVPRKHRISLFKRLHEYELLDKGIVSFNEVRDYGIGGENLTDEQLNMLPLYYDYENDYDNVNEWILTKVNRHQYENTDNIIDPHINHFTDIIENSFLTVVPETEYGIPESLTWEPDFDQSSFFCYQNGFITEKTFRHIRDGHPMLWVSAPHTIDMLHYLGFKTFGKWFDESYDRILNPQLRLDAVVSELHRICALSHNERQQMYWDMMPVLKFNQEHLLNMRHVPVLTIDDWHKYSKDWQFAEVDRIT